LCDEVSALAKLVASEWLRVGNRGVNTS